MSLCYRRSWTHSFPSITQLTIPSALLSDHRCGNQKECDSLNETGSLDALAKLSTPLVHLKLDACVDITGIYDHDSSILWYHIFVRETVRFECPRSPQSFGVNRMLTSNRCVVVDLWYNSIVAVGNINELPSSIETLILTRCEGVEGHILSSFVVTITHLSRRNITPDGIIFSQITFDNWMWSHLRCTSVNYMWSLMMNGIGDVSVISSLSKLTLCEFRFCSGIQGDWLSSNIWSLSCYHNNSHFTGDCGSIFSMQSLESIVFDGCTNVTGLSLIKLICSHVWYWLVANRWYLFSKVIESSFTHSHECKLHWLLHSHLHLFIHVDCIPSIHSLYQFLNVNTIQVFITGDITGLSLNSNLDMVVLRECDGIHGNFVEWIHIHHITMMNEFIEITSQHWMNSNRWHHNTEWIHKNRITMMNEFI